MARNLQYDHEYKMQAIKLAKELDDCAKAATELGISKNTLYGCIKVQISFYCRMLDVSREGFRKYLKNRDKPWKYDNLVDEIRKIHSEDECNDSYVSIRMYQALMLRNSGIKLPSERTVYRIMTAIGLIHRPKRKPHGITKADRNARKSEDLLCRNFQADKPLTKAVTDIFS